MRVPTPLVLDKMITAYRVQHGGGAPSFIGLTLLQWVIFKRDGVYQPKRPGEGWPTVARFRDVPIVIAPALEMI